MDGKVWTTKTSLPLSKVKSICKLDPDTGLLSSQAVQLIALATVSPLYMLIICNYDGILENLAQQKQNAVLRSKGMRDGLLKV